MALTARSMARATAPRSAVARRSVVVRASAGKDWILAQPGITGPTGFFDPAGFTDAATFTVGEGKRFREAEITHGRVAMLASLGWLVQEEFHPLFGGEISGPAFVHFQKVEAILPQFWEIVLLGIGITEAYRIGVSYNDPKDVEQIKEEHMPGNLGFDPLGLYPTDATAQLEIRTKELNNGRLAMIAIAGFAAQEEVDHITIWKGLVKEHVIPAAEANLFQ